ARLPAAIDEGGAALDHPTGRDGAIVVGTLDLVERRLCARRRRRPCAQGDDRSGSQHALDRPPAPAREHADTLVRPATLRETYPVTRIAEFNGLPRALWMAVRGRACG